MNVDINPKIQRNQINPIIQTIDVLDVRAIFVSLLEKYPDMHHYISNKINFAHSPKFENRLTGELV
jgi:hypothetical protein